MKNLKYKILLCLLFLSGVAFSQTTPEEIFQKGLEAYYGGKYADGIKYFDDYIAMRPNDYTGYNYKGLCNQGRKNYGDALNDFGRVITIAPGNSEGYLNRANTYLLAKNFGSATKDFNDAIRYDAKNIEAYIGKSMVSIAQRKFSDATKDLNSASAIEPKNARIYIAKAYVDFLTEDSTKFFDDISMAMYYDSNVVFTNHKRELLLVKLDSYRKALAVADQKIEHNPYSYMSYFQRGVIYFFMNNYSKASEDFKKSDDLNNNTNQKFDALVDQIQRSIDRNARK